MTSKIINKAAISNGHIIDEYCTHQNAEIIKHNNVVYSCTLNQTDIKTNKNKFYIMQLLNNSGTIVLYTRWGRVGEMGRPTYNNYNNINTGIKAFENQFKSKTRNKWSDKDNFKPQSGKYHLVEVSYEEELKDIEKNEDKNKAKIVPKSKLHKKVQWLLEMLSDINIMQNALVQLDIDTKKMPLGKLKKSQLDKATKVLDKIQKKIKELADMKNTNQEKKVIDEIYELSSKYYTLIPYSCGRNKPPVIIEQKMVTKYTNIINDLSNIAVGVQIINNTTKSDKNPIDVIYNDIHTNIKSVRQKSETWTELSKYIENTHGPTHGSKLQVLDIYDIEQEGKRNTYENYVNDNNIGNRTILFHGTPSSCVLSIFKNDFWLNPEKQNDPNVQISGRMFGDGCYFADVATKSFNYTRAHSSNDIGCLIMCEVALGKQSIKKDADYYINKASLARVGCHSTKALGKWAPSTGNELENIYIPNGEIKKTEIDTVLRYNEYIVYDVNQILIKYLVIVKNIGNYSGF